MAKPINLYQGPAPAAMGMMGQGILEAGANIGRTLQSGYEAMGKGISSGINAAASAYKEYKDDQAKFDATKKMVKVFGGSLNETQRKELDDIFADTSMSVREKNALAPTLMQYLGVSQQQSQAMAKQQAELDARMKQAVFTEGEQTKRTGMDITSREKQPYRQAIANYAFPDERQTAAPSSVFGPMDIPQQNPLFTPPPQNTFAPERKFSIHTQRPQVR
jgi:hypothetical protein